MLFRQKEFIKNHVAGYDDNNIILIENGDVLEIDEFGAQKLSTSTSCTRRSSTRRSIGEIEYDIVRERKKLAYGGVISLVVTVEKGITS